MINMTYDISHSVVYLTHRLNRRNPCISSGKGQLKAKQANMYGVCLKWKDMLDGCMCLIFQESETLQGDQFP